MRRLCQVASFPPAPIASLKCQGELHSSNISKASHLPQTPETPSRGTSQAENMSLVLAQQSWRLTQPSAQPLQGPLISGNPTLGCPCYHRVRGSLYYLFCGSNTQLQDSETEMSVPYIHAFCLGQGRLTDVDEDPSSRASSHGKQAEGTSPDLASFSQGGIITECTYYYLIERYIIFEYYIIILFERCVITLL